MKGFACVTGVTGSMLKETMCISETLKLTTGWYLTPWQLKQAKCFPQTKSKISQSSYSYTRLYNVVNHIFLYICTQTKGFI